MKLNEEEYISRDTYNSTTPAVRKLRLWVKAQIRVLF